MMTDKLVIERRNQSAVLWGLHVLVKCLWQIELYQVASC